MTSDAPYEYFKRYRETLARRTANAYAEWRSVKKGTTARGRIHNAELEFDRRERLQLYEWLRHHGHILKESS